MFGIGMPEMILILAIALIVIGPKKLPDLAKSLGRAMREFKKATNELKDTMQIDSELADVKKAFNDINEDVKESADLKGAPALKNGAAGAGSDESDDKKDTAPESKADDVDNLKNLKKAFDTLDTWDRPTETTESAAPDNASAGDDTKDRPHKGPVDDA
jgi:TatA/E family protein of Tat protein translocase